MAKKPKSPIRAIRLTPDEVIDKIKGGETSVARLEKLSGLSRGTIRGMMRRQAAGKPDLAPQGAIPVAPLPQSPAPAARRTPSPAPLAAKSGFPWGVWILNGIGALMGFAGVGLSLLFGLTLGRTPIESVGMAVVALCIDLTTIAMLPTAGDLWSDGKRFMALLAVAVWVASAGHTAISTSSFVASNADDRFQQRDNVEDQRKTLKEQRQADETELSGIGEFRTVEEIDAGITGQQNTSPYWRSSGGCQNATLAYSKQLCDWIALQKTARARAARRIFLQDEIKAIGEKLAALPAVSTRDPGGILMADVVYVVTFHQFKASLEQIEEFRKIGFAFAPHLAGILFLLARKRSR